MTISCGMDIGSNSFRLLVAEVQEGRLRPIAHDCVTVRLGEGLATSGLLTSAAMIRAEKTLCGFVEKIAAYPLHSLRVCATHAVRKALNNTDFLQRIETLTGLQIEVLSGEEEARLALLGALTALPEQYRLTPLLLADVGGGSSELVPLVKIDSVPQGISLPLGAVGLTEEFGADLAGMRNRIRATLLPALRSMVGGDMAGHGSRLVASGGTATSLAALSMGLDRYDGQLVQNYTLKKASLHGLVVSLAALSPGKRNSLPGLAEGRGEILVAGAVVLEELLQALLCPCLLVSDAGLLEGIVLSGAVTQKTCQENS